MNNLSINANISLLLNGYKVVPVPVKTTRIEVPYKNSNEVYVFKNQKEYEDYFRRYIKNLDKQMLETATYFIDKKGQVVAIRDLCDRIIIRERVKEFYDSYTEDKITKIHAKGKITPLEKVEEYEGFDLCAPGDHASSASNRCQFFKPYSNKCHECLLEYASHNEEYDKMDFKLVNLPYHENENQKIKK